jgi:hypothetical protein
MLEEVQDNNQIRMIGDLMKGHRECIGLGEVQDRVFEDGQTCMMNRNDKPGNICREWNAQFPVGEDCLVPQARDFLKGHVEGEGDSMCCHRQLMVTVLCSRSGNMDMRPEGDYKSVCRCPREDPADNCSRVDYFHEVLFCSVPVAPGL